MSFRAGISIHALFAEGDVSGETITGSVNNFYPRPLRRGRHLDALSGIMDIMISIHALFAEGDLRRGRSST